MKNLRYNIKRYKTYIIVILFILALLYFIITPISNLLISRKNNYISIEQINSYIKQEDVLNDKKVMDYNLFLELQDATENYISYLMIGKYDEAYSVLDYNIKNDYKKKDFMEKIDQYAQNNFPYDNGGEYSFVNSNNMVEAYTISDNSFLCKTKNAKNEDIYIGIKINSTNHTYKICYLSI